MNGVAFLQSVLLLSLSPCRSFPRSLALVLERQYRKLFAMPLRQHQLIQNVFDIDAGPMSIHQKDSCQLIR